MDEARERGARSLIYLSRLGKILRILLSVMCEIAGLAMNSNYG